FLLSLPPRHPSEVGPFRLPRPHGAFSIYSHAQLPRSESLRPRLALSATSAIHFVYATDMPHWDTEFQKLCTGYRTEKIFPTKPKISYGKKTQRRFSNLVTFL